MISRRLALTAAAAMAGVSMLSFPALAEPVKLTIWGLDGDNGLIPALAKEFDDKNDDVVVEFRAIPFDELVNEALKAFATNQAPDIICLDNPDFALFSSRGAMLDITDRVAKSSVIKTDAYYAGPLASASWDGKLYRRAEGHQHDRAVLQQGPVRQGRHRRAPDDLGPDA